MQRFAEASNRAAARVWQTAPALATSASAAAAASAAVDSSDHPAQHYHCCSHTNSPAASAEAPGGRPARRLPAAGHCGYGIRSGGRRLPRRPCLGESERRQLWCLPGHGECVANRLQGSPLVLHAECCQTRPPPPRGVSSSPPPTPPLLPSPYRLAATALLHSATTRWSAASCGKWIFSRPPLTLSLFSSAWLHLASRCYST